MRIVMASTRLAGTDGVSLEAAKMREVLRAAGHEVWYLAGELDPDEEQGVLVPEMHFARPEVRAFTERAFAGEGLDPHLTREIEEAGVRLAARLEPVFEELKPELLVVQNAWAIPMHLPLALALWRLVQRRRLPAVSHNHDYFWERPRFAKSHVRPLLARYFPPDHAVVQLSINQIAQRELKERRSLGSLLLPNVMDYDRAPPGFDAFNADFRETLGIRPEQLLLLQPTRVIPRKRIELAVDLAAELAARDPVLLVSHAAGDEGQDYRRGLETYAAERRVDLRFAHEYVAPRRRFSGQHKVYSLWDAYLHADFVTYPSRYEGFGNAMLEAVWMNKPLLIGRYPVYLSDIRPKGFRFVEVEDRIAPEVVQGVTRLLDDAELRERVVEHNRALARRHFGYDALRRVSRTALEQARARAKEVRWPA
ncbi:glycosyltransferase family 4 protein [Deinococcota bacterium DY0809b]